MKNISLSTFNEIHASIPMKFYKTTTTTLEFREFAIDSNIDRDDAQILQSHVNI